MVGRRLRTADCGLRTAASIRNPRSAFVSALLLDRNPECKGTPGPRRTRHTDVSAEQLRQAAGDEEAQARPTKPAREAAVELSERLEEARDVLLRDANTGIGNLEHQPFFVPRDRQRH